MWYLRSFETFNELRKRGVSVVYESDWFDRNITECDAAIEVLERIGEFNVSSQPAKEGG